MFVHFINVFNLKEERAVWNLINVVCSAVTQKTKKCKKSMKWLKQCIQLIAKQNPFPKPSKLTKHHNCSYDKEISWILNGNYCLEITWESFMFFLKDIPFKTNLSLTLLTIWISVTLQWQNDGATFYPRHGTFGRLEYMNLIGKSNSCCDFKRCHRSRY